MKILIVNISDLERGAVHANYGLTLIRNLDSYSLPKTWGQRTGCTGISIQNELMV